MRAFFVFIAVPLMFAMPAFSAEPVPTVGTVEVAGLTCPFCAFGLEKKLKALDFVQSVTIYVDAGRAEFEVKRGKTPDFGAAKKAVIEGGFTPGTTSLRARGALDVTSDTVVLQVDGGQSVEIGPGGKRDALVKAAKGHAGVEVEGTASMNGQRVVVVVESFKVF